MCDAAKTTFELHDPGFDPDVHLNALDWLALGFINDARDLPFIQLTLLLTLFAVPATICFYLPGKFSWWLAAGYLALNFGILLGPYTLMLHNISHRPLFKPKFRWMTAFIGWFLGPYFGQTPNTYYVHHVGMRHPENNLEDDLKQGWKTRKIGVLRVANTERSSY